MVSRKKDAYWHRITRKMIGYGLKPAQIGKVLKEVFPETEVNGRHIGAYKRRLTTEGIDIGIGFTPSPDSDINCDHIAEPNCPAVSAGIPRPPV